MDQGGEWYRIENDLHSRQKKSGGKALEAYHRCWRAWRHYRWWDVQRHVCTITRSRCTSMCQEKGKFVWSLCEVCMSFVWSLHEVCVKYIWLLAWAPMRVFYIFLLLVSELNHRIYLLSINGNKILVHDIEMRPLKEKRFCFLLGHWPPTLHCAGGLERDTASSRVDPFEPGALATGTMK